MKKRYSDYTIEDLAILFPSVPKEVILGIKYSLAIKGKRFPLYQIAHEVFGHRNAGTLILMILRCAMTGVYMPRWVGHALHGRGKLYACKIMHRWAKAECRITRSRVTTIDRNHYDPAQSYLFVVNHQSPMDIPAIYSAMRIPVGFVANSDFKKIPVFNFWMSEVGSVFVRQGLTVLDIKALKRMILSLKKGNSLIIFPEGGMSTFRDVQPFSRAGVAAAVIAGANIVPVSISGTPDIFPPGEFYVHQGAPIVVNFGAPIKTTDMSRKDRNEIAETVRAKVISLKAEGDTLLGRRHRPVS
jgi:1-acyl-sn-glycerol-3-phosphate acyltransferase